MEEILSRWLKTSDDRNFLLVIADQVSGMHDEKGRPRPVVCQLIGSTIIIDFDGSEQLTASNVTDVVTGSKGELIIKDAGEARFTWFARGEPETPSKQCKEVFNKFGKFFEFSRSGARFAASVGPVYGQISLLCFDGHEMMKQYRRYNFGYKVSQPYSQGKYL